MKTIDNYNFNGKKTLVRVDFNVPLNENFQVADDTRIKAALPTINKILSDGGSVILMSHLGRPEEGFSAKGGSASGGEEKFSLKHIVPQLTKLLKSEVQFADDCIGEAAKIMAAGLKPGEVLLLENLRFHKGETKGDEDFARRLASLADVYVNDAFGTAHRAHASTTVAAKFFGNDKMFGYLIANEIKNIDKMLNNAEKPFTAVLGGAKVSGKIQVINRLMNKLDNLIIGGGMSFTFAKALGGNIGKSLVEEDMLEMAKNIINDARKKDVNVFLPSDSVIADAFSNDAKTTIASIGNIHRGWMGLDIGRESCELFTEVIKSSRTILWNGPMGVFEMSNFEQGTKLIAEAIVKATKNGSFSLIGGGETVAAINKYGLADKFSYVSTGGGALLEYIEGKELPGIKAILE